LSLVGLAAGCVVAHADENFGRFKGELVARFLQDGRNIQLVQPFGYVDPQGRLWEAPVGYESDGAKVPQTFWIAHPPFTGKYRAAAVIFDYLCDTRLLPWREVDKIFYLAMRAAGVEEGEAKYLYAMMYYCGPRWGIGTATQGPGSISSTEQQTAALTQLDSWIKGANPAIEEIARRIDDGTFGRQ
jgi:Protein of unknown function (DUF1353)